jgi:hypothetical protein
VMMRITDFIGAPQLCVKKTQVGPQSLDLNSSWADFHCS